MFYKCNAFARWYIAKALAACKESGLKVDAEAFTHFVLSEVLMCLYNPIEDISIYTRSLGFMIPPEVLIKGTWAARPYWLNMVYTKRGKQKQKYTFTIMHLGSYQPHYISTIAAPENLQPWLEAGLYNIIERRAYE